MKGVNLFASLKNIEIKVGLALINIIIMSYLVYHQASVPLSELFYKIILIWIINLVLLRLMSKS